MVIPSKSKQMARESTADALEHLMEEDQEIPNETATDSQACPPILIFKDFSGPICDLGFIAQSLTEEGYKSEQVLKIKLDKKGNALVFCKKKEISDGIMKNEKIFNGAKKIVLDSKPTIILKNFKYDEALSHFDELKTLGITSLEIIGNNKESLITKATCKDDETVYNLLHNHVKLNFGRIVYTEPCVSTTLQYRNCKLFGHIETKCNYTKKCARCNTEHEDHQNCTNHKSCANCSEPHSSYWRGCNTFIKIKNEKINNFMNKLGVKLKLIGNDATTSSDNGSKPVPKGFYRKYGQTEMAETLDEKVAKKFLEFENSFERRYKLLLESIEAKFEHISNKSVQNMELKCRELIDSNNVQMINFIISLFVQLKNANGHMKNNLGSFNFIPLDKISEIAISNLGIEVKDHADYLNKGKQVKTSKSKVVSNINNDKRERTSDINREALFNLRKKKREDIEEDLSD